TVRAEAAWFWWLIIPALAWVWWLARRSYAQLSAAARRSSAALRLVIIVCLLGALARPVWLRSTSGQHLIFLLDVSRSISRANLQAGTAQIERLPPDAPDQGRGHRVSVIAFGRPPRLLAPASGDAAAAKS